MCLKLLPSPKYFESLENIIGAMVSKKIYKALGRFGTNSLSLSYFDNTNIYFMMSVGCYVLSSVKNSRWSSIFRILSVDLWLVLILSIMIATISTTRVGRYSCMS